MTTAATPLAAQIHDVLVEEGYGQVHYDDEGDIVFKCDGFTYMALFDRRDPRYVRLSLPNFWRIEDDEARERALRICNRINNTCKCAYVRICGDGASAGLELLMPPFGVVDGPYVRRLFSMIRTVVGEFESLMRGGRGHDHEGCIEGD